MGSPNKIHSPLIGIAGGLILATAYFGLAAGMAPFTTELFANTPDAVNAADQVDAAISNSEPDPSTGLCAPEEFECLTLDVPVDYSDSSNTKRIPVTFAVLPSRESTARTAFITIVGGPGVSGLESAAYAVPGLEALRGEYDLVFFDMRGLEIGRDVDCPKAFEANGAGYSQLPIDPQERLVSLGNLSEQFADQCLAETKNPEILEHLRTVDAAEDIERFRQAGGYDTLILYAQSYGTQLAQEYARNHPDRVERMILDGVVDQTRHPIQAEQDRIDGFEQTLEILFEACDTDRFCSFDMGAPAAEVYRDLAEQLAVSPVTVNFPIGDGTSEKFPFTADDLGYLAYSNLYEQSTRMLFLRALAAYGSSGDLVPLSRLYGTGYSAGIDPIVNTAVTCGDSAPTGDTPDIALASVGEFRAGLAPDKQWFSESLVNCIHWPYTAGAPNGPFVGSEIPTLILASDTDVATPYARAVAISEGLADGHLITVHNGSHVVFDRGISCIDRQVLEFALDGTPPSITECSVEMIEPYIGLLPTSWVGYQPAEMLGLAETEIYSAPELLGWSGVDEITVGCSGGGGMVFGGDFDLTTFELTDCALGPGLVLSGTGEFDWVRGQSSLNVTINDLPCPYTYVLAWEDLSEQTEEHCA